jgi:hypothetical protein
LLKQSVQRNIQTKRKCRKGRNWLLQIGHETLLKQVSSDANDAT